MTKSKIKAPVSSFGPELQQVLRQGANKELRIRFETTQLAARFSARINALRSAMRAEKHPDSDRLYRAGVSIPKDDPCCVVVAPKDSEFRDSISKLFSDVQPPPQIVEFSAETPRPGVVEDPATSFLATLADATKVSDENVRGEEPPSEKGVDNGDK